MFRSKQKGPVLKRLLLASCVVWMWAIVDIVGLSFLIVQFFQDFNADVAKKKKHFWKSVFDVFVGRSNREDASQLVS